MMVRNNVAQTFESARRQAGKPASQQLHDLPILAPYLCFAVLSMIQIVIGTSGRNWWRPPNHKQRKTDLVVAGQAKCATRPPSTREYRRLLRQPKDPC